MFVRKKNINGKYYAYLVENKHTKKGTRQKIKKYLGRCFEGEFYGVDMNRISNTSYSEMLDELFSGIKAENIVLNRNGVFYKNRRVVVQVNSGFIHTGLLKKLYSLKKTDEIKPGVELASLLASTGIEITPEFFVRLYGVL